MDGVTTDHEDASRVTAGISESQAAEKWNEIAPFAERLAERSATRGEFTHAEGSALTGDDRAADPYQVSHAFRMTLTASIDHFHAVKCLVVDLNTLHVAAPASLARGMLEKSAAGFWMLHPTSRNERVSRALKWMAKNFQAQHKAIDKLAVPPNSALEHKLKKIDAVAQKRGLDIKDIRRGYTSTDVLRYAEANLAQLPLGIVLPWQICSGFAHGRPWAYLGVSNKEQSETSNPDVRQVKLTNDLARGLYPVLAGLHLMQETLRVFESRRT